MSARGRTRGSSENAPAPPIVLAVAEEKQTVSRLRFVNPKLDF
jgi:hypothetical protein